MDKCESMILKDHFCEYKAEYSDKNTKEERKKKLIQMMQTNLKERCGKDCGYIKGLDGKDYSLTSDNVKELYAIDGALNAETSKTKMTENSDIARKSANDCNQ